jgi:hypothetical protein
MTYQNDPFPVDPPPATRAVLAEPEFASYRITNCDALFEAARLLLLTALTLEDPSTG